MTPFRLTQKTYMKDILDINIASYLFCNILTTNKHMLQKKNQKMLLTEEQLQLFKFNFTHHIHQLEHRNHN